MCLPSPSIERLQDSDALRYIRLHEHGQARFVIGEGVRYESSHYAIATEATSCTRVEPEFHGARDGRRTLGAVPARLPGHCSFVPPSDARAGGGGIPLRRAVHARLLADRARARRPP